MHPSVEAHEDTQTSCLVEGWPVLLVAHDETGIWHLMSDLPAVSRPSGAVSPTHEMTWASLIAADPTLRELEGLPRGWMASRTHPHRPWQRQPG